MEWLKKLSEAIAYIEDNLDNEISYDKAAEIACCSTCYFQRIFSYVTGISLSEYVRRRKMTMAAFELQNTNQKVIDIALKYGYTSPTSFNRAFQNVHGITPILAKKIGNKLNAYPRVRLSVQVLGGEVLSYHIEKKDAIRTVGVRTILTSDMEENQSNVPLFWQSTLKTKEFKALCSLSNQSPKGVLGISAYECDREYFYYVATATDKRVPQGMYEYEIPKATWVVFENDGQFKENVQSIFRRFFTEWLPFSGYVYAGLPDIEVYPISDDKPIAGHSEVWIAIKKEKEN